MAGSKMSDIKGVGVVGAGQMGNGIAHVCALAGYDVFLNDADPARIGCQTASVIRMPKVHPIAAPLLYAIPVQLMAYHTAVFMGTDVDQPRNLAKSVTVE